MSEQMLRDALHDAMADSPAPPPMTSATVVRRARRVRARRRVAWSGAGCAAVVATMAVTASVLPGTGRTAAPVQLGASPRVTVPPPTGTPTPSGSPGAWPTGPDGKPQQDRTATAGVRYVQAVHLLDALSPAVPDGYRVAGTNHQAEFMDRVNGVDVWQYDAFVEVSKGGGTGELLAEVQTPGNTLPGTDACGLAQAFWGLTGKCQVVAVGSTNVGVVVQPTGQDRRLDQWAAYRYADGTVVFVAQAAGVIGGSGRALGALPLTVSQLAALAADERFHLT